MEDRAIVDMFWRREEEAVAAVQTLYGSYCRRIALRILNDRDDAEECVNSTWLAAWESIPPNRPDNLAHYLGRLTRRISIDCLRRNTAQKRGGGEAALELEELEGLLADKITPESEVERQEFQKAVNRAVREMKEPMRSIFIRRYWFMDSMQEIAERFGMTQGTAATQLSRARKKLRAALKGWLE